MGECVSKLQKIELRHLPESSQLQWIVSTDGVLVELQNVQTHFTSLALRVDVDHTTRT